MSRLAAYLDTLAAWSRRVNLTGARTPPSACASWSATSCPLAASAPDPPRRGVGNGSPASSSLSSGTISMSPCSTAGPRWAFPARGGPCRGPPVRVLRVRHDGYPGLPHGR